MYYQLKNNDDYISVISLFANPLLLRDCKRSDVACYYDILELKKAKEFCDKKNIKYKVEEYGTI